MTISDCNFMVLFRIYTLREETKNILLSVGGKNYRVNTGRSNRIRRDKTNEHRFAVTNAHHHRKGNSRQFRANFRYLGGCNFIFAIETA